MTNLDRSRAEKEARRSVAETRRSTPFGEAINQYLGASGYRDPYRPGSATRAPVAPARPVPANVRRTDTGGVGARLLRRLAERVRAGFRRPR